MLFTESIIKCVDNSGPRTVKCLKLHKNHGNSKIVRLGQEAIIAPQKKQVKFRKRLIEKKVFIGIVIMTNAKTRRLGDTFVQFTDNRCLIMNEEYRFLGTRVKGPICREIRKNKLLELKYKRIISYSKLTI